MLDFVLRQARLTGHDHALDIGVADGRIAVIEPEIATEAPSRSAEGRFVCSGLSDAHIHLDKAAILGRCPICEGTLSEAVRGTSAAKAAFTEEDVHERAGTVVHKAIGHGTMRMRSFVETDPRTELRAFDALMRLKRETARAIDIDLCAFAQEGLTQEMATFDLMARALEGGATSVGGCPYQDPDPVRHIGLVLDLAERFAVPADFHIDFDLDPEGSDLPALIEAVESRRLGGRVTIGHATKLSAFDPSRLAETARRLAGAGIGVVTLPATDLFLTGREAERLVPRGVAPAHGLARAGVRTAAATNNVLNPFTPYGDANLMRIANLFANVAQLATDADLAEAFAMVGENAAAMIAPALREGASAGGAVTVGAQADLLVLDAPDAATAVRTVAQPIAGYKRGRLSFEHQLPRIYP